MNSKKELIVVNTKPANIRKSILSTKKVMDEFLKEIEHSLVNNPNDEKLLGAKWAYKIAVSQFHNRFSRYYQRTTAQE